MDFPYQGIPLYKECFLYKACPPLIRHVLPLQGISHYKGFPFIRDFHLQGISLYNLVPFIRDLPLQWIVL